MRSLSGASLAFVAVLALGSFTSAVGCAKVGELQAKKAFKAANAAYQQQDYKKAAELYEETVDGRPQPEPAPTSSSATATTTSTSRARRATPPTTRC